MKFLSNTTFLGLFVFFIFFVHLMHYIYNAHNNKTRTRKEISFTVVFKNLLDLKHHDSEAVLGIFFLFSKVLNH